MRVLLMFGLLGCALAMFSWSGRGDPSPNETTDNVCLADETSCGCCLMQKMMWRMETFFNMSLNELQRGLERAHSILNNIQASRSAFSVALTDTGLCMGPYSEDLVVKYGSVFINVGDNYNTSSGIFVPRRSGVYNLALTVYSNSGAPGVRLAACAHLRLNGRVLASLSENNVQDQEDSVSAVMAVQMRAGDAVDVLLPAGCFLCDDKNHYNTFTGFLLYPTD